MVGWNYFLTAILSRLLKSAQRPMTDDLFVKSQTEGSLNATKQVVLLGVAGDSRFHSGLVEAVAFAILLFSDDDLFAVRVSLGNLDRVGSMFLSEPLVNVMDFEIGHAQVESLFFQPRAE